jgi:hypothetical protein
MARLVVIAVVASVAISVGMTLLMKALGFEVNAGVVGGVTGGLVAVISTATMKKGDGDTTTQEGETSVDREA